MKIDDYIDEDKCYIIAEIGQNHQGQLGIAKQLVDAAANAGADAIKTVKRDLKIFKERNPELWNSSYDNPNSFGTTYGEHRTALELSESAISELKFYVENVVGIDFICSFTDENSMTFLHNIGLKIFKVPSQRLTDYTLLQKLAQLHVPVILSTGMSTMKEVKLAVNLLRKTSQLYLLQCTSAYPCMEKDLNLRVIPVYKEAFGLPVGFSGHHIGIAPDIVAYIMGARIIERHFTLCRAWKGTDHAASLEPAGLKYVCKYIQQAYESLGSNEKEILKCERKAMKRLRADLL